MKNSSLAAGLTTAKNNVLDNIRFLDNERVTYKKITLSSNGLNPREFERALVMAKGIEVAIGIMKKNSNKFN